MIVVLKVWTHPLSALAGGLVALVALLWPAVPLGSFAVWFATLMGKFPTNVLYPVLVLLLGAYVALYTYDRWVGKCCRVGTGKSGTLAAALGVFLGACPACIPAIAVFLPLSLAITLGYYSGLILLTSVLLLLFSIWRMGGFQRV